jgi:hypothetical protein
MDSETLRRETAEVPGRQQGIRECQACGRSPASEGVDRPDIAVPPYVYALGHIEPRLPSLGIEKEFAQATGRAETVNMTDRKALHTVLSQNRYLARQLCYVFTIQGLDTYLLQAARSRGRRIPD